MAVAAEAGSVVELQKHLDRRKFALSRDRGTAATILHKAVALAHQEVARYSIKGKRRKIAAGFVDTGGKFATGVVDSGGAP